MGYRKAGLFTVFFFFVKLLITDNAPFDCSEQAVIFSQWNGRSIMEKEVIQ